MWRRGTIRCRLKNNRLRQLCISFGLTWVMYVRLQCTVRIYDCCTALYVTFAGCRMATVANACRAGRRLLYRQPVACVASLLCPVRPLHMSSFWFFSLQVSAHFRSVAIVHLHNRNGVRLFLLYRPVTEVTSRDFAFVIASPLPCICTFHQALMWAGAADRTANLSALTSTRPRWTSW